VGSIPRIGVREIYVPQVPTWAIDLPLSIPQAPPVTLQIGFPTVEMPGCVEARETQGNNKLIEDDPQGTLTLCSGPGMPYFNPPEFDPSKELVVIPMDNSPNIGAVSGLGGNNSEKKNESTTEGTGQVTNIPDLDVDAIASVDIDLPCPRPGRYRFAQCYQQLHASSGHHPKYYFDSCRRNSRGGPSGPTSSTVLDEGCEASCEESDEDSSKEASEEREDSVCSREDD